MISAAPDSASFRRGIAAAETALSDGGQVYVYCIDRGVEGVGDPHFAQMKQRGAHWFACAYSLQRRGLTAPPEATLAGLTILSDIMASVEAFESFN